MADDKENPTWTNEDFARAKPTGDIPKLAKVLRKMRGPQKAPTKKQVTLRLEQGIIDHFKSEGPGWQTRINETLVNTVLGFEGRIREISTEGRNSRLVRNNLHRCSVSNVTFGEQRVSRKPRSDPPHKKAAG